LSLEDVEAYLTLAAVPVSIVFIVLAVWSVRHEVHWLQVLFDVVLVGSTGYFAFKLWRIWGNNDKKILYQTDQKSLTVFGNPPLMLFSFMVLTI
jgi:hypothetical protein